MLRASALALLLMTAPVYAQEVPEPFDLDAVLIEVFTGQPADEVTTDDEDVTTAYDDDEDSTDDDTTSGYYIVYDDTVPIDPTSTFDPRSPAYVPPATLESGYDPEGSDKYMENDNLKPGDEGWDGYVEWFMQTQKDAYRPKGMNDSELVVWIEDGCPGDDAHTCGSPAAD